MNLFPEKFADRYKQFKFRHFLIHKDYYRDLAENGQSPDLMVISCCDSRVDPEAIFNSLPGEIFVVRNVANLVPPYETAGTYHGVSAALEFAVLSLNIKHIVVLGHSGCGGIRACLEHGKQHSGESFISNWMKILDKPRAHVLTCEATICAPSLISLNVKSRARSIFMVPILILRLAAFLSLMPQKIAFSPFKQGMNRGLASKRIRD
jgi:carbonic anhydrase